MCWRLCKLKSNRPTIIDTSTIIYCCIFIIIQRCWICTTRTCWIRYYTCITTCTFSTIINWCISKTVTITILRPIFFLSSITFNTLTAIIFKCCSKTITMTIYITVCNMSWITSRTNTTIIYKCCSKTVTITI